MLWYPVISETSNCYYMAETTVTMSLSCGGGRFRSITQRRSSGKCIFSGFVSSAARTCFFSSISLVSLDSIIKHMAKSCSGEPSETELAGSWDSFELTWLVFCFFPDSNTLFLLLFFVFFFLETSALLRFRTGSTDSGSVSVSLL